MGKMVSAAEANRNFSALLRRVQQGERVTITSRGRPVAEIVPPQRSSPAARDIAWDALFARLRKQEIQSIGPWNRAELYERDPK